MHGVYFTPRGAFIGDVVSSTPGERRTTLSLVEGADHMPDDPAAFDASCVIAAMRFLAEGAKAMIYVPVCYSNLIRATTREDYERLLSVLPPDFKPRLAAAV